MLEDPCRTMVPNIFQPADRVASRGVPGSMSATLHTHLKMRILDHRSRLKLRVPEAPLVSHFPKKGTATVSFFFQCYTFLIWQNLMPFNSIFCSRNVFGFSDYKCWSLKISIMNSLVFCNQTWLTLYNLPLYL